MPFRMAVVDPFHCSLGGVCFTTRRATSPMSDTPQFYARMTGDVLEIVTDRLTVRTPSGALVSIEDYIRDLFARTGELRVMTVDEAPWVLSEHIIAPPLSKAA